jgi:hypothetical protein
VLATIPLPPNSHPTDVVVNPAGTLAYVSTAPIDRVYAIDTATDTIATSFPTGIAVAEAMNPAGTALYIADDNPMDPTGAVAALDPATGRQAGVIKIEDEPLDIALGPAAPGTATSLALSPSGTATQGAPVTMTATVSPATSGTVQFYDTAALALGAVPLGAPVPVTNGTATFSTTALSADTHALSAAFTPSQTGLLRSASTPVSLQVVPPGVHIDDTISQNGTGTVTTAPLSTPGPRLVLAFTSSDGPAAKQTTTVTGAGLTWNLVRRANGQHGTAEIWSALASSPLTGATITSTPQVAGYDQQLTVVTLTGAAGTGASAAAGKPSGTESVSVTTTAAGSQIFGVGEDYSNALSRSVGSGQYLLGQWVDTGPGNTFWTQTTFGPTSATGTKVTLNETAPTGDIWNMAAAEVLAATS